MKTLFKVIFLDIDGVLNSQVWDMEHQKEIRAWLREHREVENWVVLDDLDLQDEGIAGRQVRTDAEAGLTEEDVKRALTLLNISDSSIS